MNIYLLERLRKFFKSVGKKEEKINDLITNLKFRKNDNFTNFTDENFTPDKGISDNIKLAAIIGFFYNETKLPILFKVCESLVKISNKSEIYILTNSISPSQKEKIENGVDEKIKIIFIDEIVHNRLLPWYHLNLMRKLYDKEEITHFLYLEDDILFNRSNFNYWINSRKILRKSNLIPGFTRVEINQNNKELYAVDFTKKNNIKKLPKLKVNENYEFVNHKFPYQGMYLYDRELMKEHLQGPSSNPDCGHGAFDTNYIDSRMINLDLMAKANIGLTYINAPSGFFNRMVTLFNIKEKEIDYNCQIQHLTNKYTNLDSLHGNIKLKDAIK
jgi:hypothetical protein